MNTPTILASLLASALLLAACSDQAPSNQPAEPAGPAASDATIQPAEAGEPVADVQAQFLAAIAGHCGKAYAGRITANEPPPDTADPFDGKTLVMHVRECSDGALRIPFHVGDDHSRTWVLTRTDTALRLKHDHRHADGSDDPVTMYGGDTVAAGTPQRQEFPVDAESIAMFEREGLDASVSNTWAIEIVPAERFVYELSRPGGRLFRVEFDLATPVDTPPAPWGAD